MFLKIYLILCFINSYDKIPDICFDIENAIIYKYDRIIELKYENQLDPITLQNLQKYSILPIIHGKRDYIIRNPKITNIVTINDSIFWKNNGPLKFLHLLRSSAGKTYYFIKKFPDSSWITERHIPILMKYIQFKQPSSFVKTINSSFIIPRETTMGEQALLLIKGFIRKKYPPYRDFFSCAIDPNDIIKWYRHYNNRTKGKPK